MIRRILGRLVRRPARCGHGIPAAECNQPAEHATIRAVDRWDEPHPRPHPGASAWGKS